MTQQDVLEAIQQDIHEMRAQVTAMAIEVARIAAQCPGCSEKLESLLVTTYGTNGQKGLTTRVASLEQSRDLHRYGLRALWGCITGLVGAAAAAIVHWLRS